MACSKIKYKRLIRLKTEKIFYGMDYKNITG